MYECFYEPGINIYFQRNESHYPEMIMSVNIIIAIKYLYANKEEYYGKFLL